VRCKPSAVLADGPDLIEAEAKDNKAVSRGPNSLDHVIALPDYQRPPLNNPTACTGSIPSCRRLGSGVKVSGPVLGSMFACRCVTCLQTLPHVEGLDHSGHQCRRRMCESRPSRVADVQLPPDSYRLGPRGISGV
jgi:hypothetical protein